jgi:hypothetical protein
MCATTAILGKWASMASGKRKNSNVPAKLGIAMLKVKFSIVSHIVTITQVKQLSNGIFIKKAPPFLTGLVPVWLV